MTSPVDTTVKFFASDMPGAPVLSGVAGALIDVLSSCLVDGFGLKSVTSLVVAGGVATLNHGGGLSAAMKNSVILVAGATPSALNGEQKVTAVTATTVQFATAQADGVATGTITFKMAPAGWTKSFSGTNLAAYLSNNVAATHCYLRVDDTGSTSARLVGYETMSDVNTGTGAFPTSAQMSGGEYWAKSSGANSTSRPWVLVSDGRTMYLAVAYTNGTPLSYQTYAFGDLINFKASDPYACVLAGSTSDESGTTAGSLNSTYDRVDGNAMSGACYAPRAFTGYGSAIQLRRAFANIGGFTSGSFSGAGAVPYPNPSDGALYVLPQYLLENTNVSIRGMSAGYYCTPQALGQTAFATKDTITGVTGLSGRTLMAITSNVGAAFVDITGPWR